MMSKHTYSENFSFVFGDHEVAGEIEVDFEYTPFRAAVFSYSGRAISSSDWGPEEPAQADPGFLRWRLAGEKDWSPCPEAVCGLVLHADAIHDILIDYAESER